MHAWGATELQARAEHWGSAGRADSSGVRDCAGCCNDSKHIQCVGCWGAELSCSGRRREGGTLTRFAEPTSRWIFGKRDIDVT